MRTRPLIVALVLSLALSGCGRAATSSVDLDDMAFTPHLPLERQVIPKDKIRPDAKPPVGVVVKGRVYPKGEEPTVTEAADPGAPVAGHGHLTVWLSLSKRTVRTEALRLVASYNGQGDATLKTFEKGELIGTDLTFTFPNLVPGDYTIHVLRQVETGEWFPAGEAEAVVEADATGSVKIF